MSVQFERVIKDARRRGSAGAPRGYNHADSPQVLELNPGGFAMTAQAPTLTLKTAIGGYGHHAALKDGSLAPEGVSLDHVEVTPIINAFRRMCRGLEFDVCEMAITTYLTARRYGIPFTAIPVFPVRAFHHGAAMGNTKAGVSGPKDLEGK